MNSYVLEFQEIDKTKLMVVGGKGANLGELSRIVGIRVPEGFCVTTEAYQKIIGQAPEVNALLDQLSLLKVDERERIGKISGTNLYFHFITKIKLGSINTLQRCDKTGTTKSLNHPPAS